MQIDICKNTLEKPTQVLAWIGDAQVHQNVSIICKHHMTHVYCVTQQKYRFWNKNERTVRKQSILMSLHTCTFWTLIM